MFVFFLPKRSFTADRQTKGPGAFWAGPSRRPTKTKRQVLKEWRHLRIPSADSETLSPVATFRRGGARPSRPDGAIYFSFVLENISSTAFCIESFVSRVLFIGKSSSRAAVVQFHLLLFRDDR
ncbi:hypothetical protein EVAR_97572_1 [Eumeta japonica]|uniref:Uncharacterized protein n=1 Tax=Eumeta variegata TaxID=151549 RepID=A0A4C1WRP3_EUMVA|nr:hypothetical protein EVAR_97572_1 [Eumeta japonica]